MDAEDIYYFPLSFAQQRLWLFQQVQPQSTAYNITGALVLTGALHVDALAAAIQRIVARHEVLRTSFRTHAGETVQWVQPALDVPLEKHTLAPQTLDLQLAECRRSAAQLAEHVFDLEQAPLVKLQLLKLADDRHVLLSVVHHIVSDGWSMRVFMDELTAFYSAELSGQPAQLPELDIQYGDYAIWQREWFDGEIRERHMRYWERQLTGAPALIALPTDFPRPAVQRYLGTTLTVELTEQQSTALKQLAGAYGATLHMVLLSAFFAVLHRYSLQQDLVVGTPVANRNQHELEPLIGFFVNTLAIRAQVAADTTFADLLQQVKTTSIEALDYQDCPFEQLVERLNPPRHQSYAPLIQVLFSFQNAAEHAGPLPGIAISQLQLSRNQAQFDLTLAACETETTISLEFGFNRELFEAETVADLARYYQHFCAQVAASPMSVLADVALIDAREYPALLAAWRNAEASEAVKLVVADLFAPSDGSSAVAENLHYCVLDRQLRPVPFGIPGELCVGLPADIVAARTEALPVIEPNPLADSGVIGLYRSGRQAVLTRTRGFEFFPRQADEAGARFRLDLAHLQQLLHAHEDVRQAAVVSRTDGTGRAVILAYVVAAREELTLEALKHYLAAASPQYVLPEQWRLVETLPLTAEGTVDLSALAETGDDESSVVNVTAPENAIEETLIAIWRQVLLAESIGTKHNFFDVGGHSLNAGQIVTRIKQAFDVDMPLRVVFEHPTIKQQAEWVLTAQFEALNDDEQAELLNELVQLNDEDGFDT